MASTRQLQHHARFHAAVLRYLFPPSPPHASSHQETSNESCEEVCFQAESRKGTELFAEEKLSDHEDAGMEAGKALLSRAQRKRLKLKKLKEERSGVMPAKRVIGPSLPDVLKKRRHEVVGYNSACALLQDHGISEKCHTLLNTQDTEDVHNAGELEESYAKACAEDREDVHDMQEDELAKNVHNAGELESSYAKACEEKDGHDRAVSEPLSKAKRRRLAKKKFQDSLQRYPQAGSSFTAEIKGGDIIIKQMV